MTLEASIEKKLCDEIKSAGGICLKLNASWCVGIPDRLCILPTPSRQARVVFVELKRPKGGRLSVAQKWWKSRLTSLGCEWYVISTPEQLHTFVWGADIHTV